MRAIRLTAFGVVLLSVFATAQTTDPCPEGSQEDPSKPRTDAPPNKKCPSGSVYYEECCTLGGLSCLSTCAKCVYCIKTSSPTNQPTAEPTKSPTKSTEQPTETPTKSPTRSPTFKGQTWKPSAAPTAAPTNAPSQKIEGSSGQCSEEIRALSDNGELVFDTMLQACGSECAAKNETTECFQECFLDGSVRNSKNLTMSDKCSGCFDAWSACGEYNCDCSNSSSEVCQSCLAEHCSTKFISCTGFILPSTLPQGSDPSPTDDPSSNLGPVLGGSIVAVVLATVAGAVLYNRRKESLSQQRIGDPKPHPVSIRNPMRISVESPLDGGPEETLEFVTRHAFKAQEDDELSADSGARIIGLRRVNKEWWWARNPKTGKEGIIPSNILSPRS